MWPSWCCNVRRIRNCFHIRREEQDRHGGVLASQPYTTTEQRATKVNTEGQISRPRSGKKQSLENIPEQKESESETNSMWNQDVIQNPSCASSEFKTPPTHQRKKPLAQTQGPFSISQEILDDDHNYYSIQELVSKIDETETQRQKQQEEFMKQQVDLVKQQEEFMKQQVEQHKEHMKQQAELVKKIDTLVTEMKESREIPERTASIDGVKRADRHNDISFDGDDSQLPQNTSVSLKVLARLSERVTRKWKFLARELGIEEHEIQRIKEDNAGDIQEQSYQMLLKWTQSQSGGSYPILGEAVRKTLDKQRYLNYVTMVNEVERSQNSAANSP